ALRAAFQIVNSRIVSQPCATSSRGGESTSNSYPASLSNWRRRGERDARIKRGPTRANGQGFVEGAGSGLSPEICTFGIFISWKSAGTRNSASLNRSRLIAVIVLVISPPFVLTWVRRGNPGKSR